MLRACPREKETRELLLRGQWPESCAAELREHVSGCRACSDLVLVMQAFRQARATAVSAANPPAAGVLWWRAQLERRKAAVERIGRPIFGAQIFALAITIVIGAVLTVSQLRNGLAWLAWLRQLSESGLAHFAGLWPSSQSTPLWPIVLLISGVAAIAVLGGFVVYGDRLRQ
jgi:hypothetical protein